MADVTDTFYTSDGFVGYGSQLLVGQNDGSPETFLALREVVSIKPGKLTSGIVDMTHMRSLGRAREKKATLRDFEAIVVKCNWVPKDASQAQTPDGTFTAGGMLALNRSQAETNFIIRVADGSPETELPFRGVVTGYDPGEIGIDTKGEITFEITPLFDYTADLP